MVWQKDIYQGVKIMKVYSLCTYKHSPETPDKGWLSRMKQMALCPGCLQAKRTVKALDVVLKFAPEKFVINAICGIPVGIAQRAFLARIGADSIRNIAVGKVSDCDGHNYPEFATFRSNKPIHYRGNEKSTCRICGECSRPIYWPAGRRYLIGKELVGGPIWYDSFDGLVVTEAIKRKLNGTKFNGLSIDPIQVRSEPIDGFGDIKW